MKRLIKFYYSIHFSRVAFVLILAWLPINSWQRERNMEILNRRFDDLPCNAECLDKRAINQIILLNASLENRPLNAEEIDIIKQNWHGARYDKIDKDLKVKE